MTETQDDPRLAKGSSVSPTLGMTVVRWTLGAVGVLVGLFGAWSLWGVPVDALIRIAVWTAAGVILHDFAFAPCVAALGYTSRRLIRAAWWKPVVGAAVCSATLILLAIPVFDTPGAKPDNATVLDRDYPVGLGIALALVWGCVPVYCATAAVLRRRRVARAPRPE